MILRRLVAQGLAFSYGGANHNVYTAHPFLRDHFKKLLGVKTEDVHEVLRKKLAPSLQFRPGELPSDTETLNRLEALIEHTRLAGKVEEAFGLYWYELGNAHHLGHRLGECRRGKRIVEGFSSNGSPEHCARSLSLPYRAMLITEWGMFAHYLGDLALAKRCYADRVVFHGFGKTNGRLMLLCNIAAAELHQGRFQSMARHAEEAQQWADEFGDTSTRSLVCMFLAIQAFFQGNITRAWKQLTEMNYIRSRWPYSTSSMWEAEFWLRLGNRAEALKQIQQNLEVCETTGYRMQTARLRTLLGRAVLVDSPAEARNQLSLARAWTSRAGDMDITLASHVLAAHIEFQQNHFDLAHAEASEGLLLAETHGYGLYAIDLLLLLARASLARNAPIESFCHAKLALDRSTDAECGYAWGEADALHLLGLAHRDLGERDKARERFEQAAEIRARIEHPEAEDSRALANA